MTAAFAQGTGGLWLPRRPSLIRAGAVGDGDLQRICRGDWWAERWSKISVVMNHIFSPGLDSPFAPGTMQGRPYTQTSNLALKATTILKEAATGTYTAKGTLLIVWIVSAGGGGRTTATASGGGTGGQAYGTIACQPGQQFAYSVGVGGGLNSGAAANTPGNTSLGTVLITGGLNGVSGVSGTGGTASGLYPGLTAITGSTGTGSGALTYLTLPNATLLDSNFNTSVIGNGGANSSGVSAGDGIIVLFDLG